MEESRIGEEKGGGRLTMAETDKEHRTMTETDKTHWTVAETTREHRITAETRELLAEAHAGNQAARKLLVEQNTGLVRSIVSRFTGRGVDREDLFQIGMIGLIKAIDYFDLKYDVRFSSYAVPMISGELRRFLRDDGMVKVSRSIRDNRVKVSRIREELMAEYGREPILTEIEEASGLSVEDVLLAVNSAQEVESLQKTIYEGDGGSIRLMDKLSMKGSEGDAALDRLMLSDTLAALDHKERELIILRFYFDQTQSQIAGRMGVSQVQVSRLEKKILKKMKMLIS